MRQHNLSHYAVRKVKIFGNLNESVNDFLYHFTRLEMSTPFPFILIERVEQQLCLLVTDVEGGSF